MLAESTVTHHPAYVGHQLAAPLPLTALGSLVVAVVNGSGAIYQLSQAGGACELALSKHLTARLCMPETAGGMIVHGGPSATLTALVAARQAQAGFDVWRDGAHGGPPLALLASDQTHYSTARAAQIMGFGRAGAISVASDERFRMRPDALSDEIAAARARGQRPIAVVASAGTTTTGAFDPLEEIAEVCADEGLSLHVDAAHGGSAALGPSSPRNSPASGAPTRWSGISTRPCRPRARLVARVRSRERCLRRDRPEGRLSLPQRGCRRREHGHAHARVHTPATLAGRVPRLRDGGHRRPARARREAVGARAGARGDRPCERRFELALEPECNVVCFRHRVPEGMDSDAHEERIRIAVNASGEFFVVQTKLRGVTWLRCALMNAATTRDDLLGMLAALRAA